MTSYDFYDPFRIFHSEWEDPALFRGLHKRPEAQVSSSEFLDRSTQCMWPEI